MNNDSEARDYHGRWTSGGIGAPAPATDKRNIAYHGTTKDFTQFNKGDPAEFMLDRALGPHFAKDPEIANSFVLERVNGRDVGPKEGGRIMPVTLPSDDKFLVPDQPRFDWAKDNPALKEWEARPSDQGVIEQMIAKEGYMKDPAMLERYLQQARALPADKAAEVARDLVAGKKADIDGGSDMDRFVRNYGGRPYNDADRAKMVELAKQSWQDQGYKGIKYINTSPMENATAKDPTSYIVFDPKDVKPLYAGGHDPETKKYLAAYTSKLLSSAAAGPYIAGLSLPKWAASFARDDVNHIDNAVRSGVIGGLNNTEIARKVIGSMGLNGVDGVTEITRQKIARLGVMAIKKRGARK